MTLSTGELPMEIKVSEDKGRKALAGQTVRMSDILADRETGHGAFNNAGAFANAGQLADALKDEAVANYGVAGPEFVRRIYYQLGIEEAKKFVREKIKEFVAANVPLGSDGQVTRVATRLGLIAAAGELATQLGITGWKKGRPTLAAAWAFKSWLNRRGGVEASEIRQAIAQVRLFIEQFGESRFDPLDVADFTTGQQSRRLADRIRFDAAMADPPGDLEIRGLPRPRLQPWSRARSPSAKC